jgi:hypothetical protein
MLSSSLKKMVVFMLLVMTSSTVLAVDSLRSQYQLDEAKLRSDNTVLISIPNGARVVDVPQKPTPVVKEGDLIVSAYVQDDSGSMKSDVACDVKGDLVTCSW